MSIPKIIHYCWFGRKPKPKLAEKCIKSWKKFCPDYEIIEWNEDNFDVSTAPLYVRQAYEAKYWAFVTDYVRLKAMTEMGGIYMDTDVEVIKPLDAFLKQEAFAGFEHIERIQTGLLACRKGFPLFQEFLHYYDNAVFLRPDGSVDTTTNVEILTNLCRQRGLALNDQYQVVDGFAIYPKEVFCPVDFDTKKLKKTRKTVTIHWFAGSWQPEEDLKILQEEERQRRRERSSNFRLRIGKAIFGETGYEKLKTIIKRK